MQSPLIVDLFQKIVDGGPSLGDVPVLISMNLFVFERFDERFTGGVRLRRQLHRSATVRTELFGSPTRSTPGTAASSNWLRTRTHGVRIGFTFTTNINN
jgi:hypothetical protein